MHPSDRLGLVSTRPSYYWSHGVTLIGKSGTVSDIMQSVAANEQISG
jgi:hypothetical protein